MARRSSDLGRRFTKQLAPKPNLVDPADASRGPVLRSAPVQRSSVTASPRNRPPAPGRASRRKLVTTDYQALGAFRLALRRFLAFSEAEARAVGLTPRQHQALLAVRAHAGPHPMTVGQLAESLLIKNHSAVGLVERLVERGLVVRAPAAQDRRRVELSLTQAGAAALETISRNNLGKLKSTVPVFTELLLSLEQLELPAPRDVERRRSRGPNPSED